MDALYGDLIFEFKRRLDDASRAEGIEELQRYILNQKHPDRFIGVLTDGETLEVYTLHEDVLEPTDSLRLAKDRTEEAEVWLDCYLFHEKNLVPTANDIALRFGDRGPTFRRSLHSLESMWRGLSDSPAAQTKFAEWESLLSIVYGSRIGDEALFLRHTYLALFARLLAFVALERRAPNNGELDGLLTGQTFRRMGFENFVEDDFFTWATERTAHKNIRAMLGAVATRLAASYDLSQIHEDLLKELYQELVDPETRHDLGEFYTPDWLAELTLRRAGFPSDAGGDDDHSILDPSCGSGTFLFTAVRLLREGGLRGEDLVRFCRERLAGLDIHPLAVTIAKTNLLLALGDDVRERAGAFTLPIYMADTLFARVQREETIPVDVDLDELADRVDKRKPTRIPEVFDIPLDLADDPEALDEAIDALIEYASPDIDQADARAGFDHRLTQIGAPHDQRHSWLRNLGLMRWIMQPPATDSVWRFILKNACQPELLARRRFSLVVGNPPWLSYRYIARSRYQQRVAELMRFYELVGPREGHLRTQMELASLFFAFCADRYLRDGGALAFVMPRSILTGAKQHERFRRRYLPGARLVIDCERVQPLFNVPACSVIWTGPPAEDADDDPTNVPTLVLEGALPGRNESYGRAMERLTQRQDRHAALKRTRSSPYLQRIIQGATIVPRCLWFVRPPESARAIDPRRPQLETDPAVQRQAKKPWKGLRLTGGVEAEHLYATLLSDNMLPFGWRALSMVVLPLDEQGELLDASDAVRRGSAGLADWLRKADKVWRRHRKSDTDLLEYIDWQSKLSSQRSEGVLKLLYATSGSHVCSCVVNTAHFDSIVGHISAKGFLADTTTYRFETVKPEEAHYLSAVLNAPCVDEAIKPHQAKGAFGSARGGGHRHIHRRPFEVLPIPPHQPGDATHRRLADLSRECHEAVRRFVASADEKTLKTPIGRLRTRLRREALADPLKEIDALARQCLSQTEGSS